MAPYTAGRYVSRGTATTMQYLIGTDEAGYGPNLGPLVISATVWQVPDDVGSGDLYQRLADVVVPTAEQAVENPTACVAIADSKALYKSGRGLRHLERGLWAALAVVGRRPQTWREVWEALAPGSGEHLRAIPWYAAYDSPVPLDADPVELPLLGRALREGLAAAGVRLTGLASRPVFPAQFNEVVARHDSKGSALSHLTLDLVAEVMHALPRGAIRIICDKHGGRNRYGRLLAGHFPQWLVEVYGEDRRRSVYRFGPPHRRVEFRFQSKAESHLPSALASLASKYLRELAMRALNDFWRGRVPNLRPTAGYPRDAKRFKAEILGVQTSLGIEDQVLWRMR
jgi:hypothetical protein